MFLNSTASQIDDTDSQNETINSNQLNHCTFQNFVSKDNNPDIGLQIHLEKNHKTTSKHFQIKNDTTIMITKEIRDKMNILQKIRYITIL